MTVHDPNFVRQAAKVVAIKSPPFAFHSPDDDGGPVCAPTEIEERMTIAGLLCRTGLTIVFGKGSSLKTWLALSVGVHVAAVGPKAPTHVYDPRTGLEITRRGRVTIYTAEDTYERVNRRIWSIIVNDLGMDADSDDAKRTRQRVRVIAPLSLALQLFPFRNAYLFDDENESRKFDVNVKGLAIMTDIERHNAGRDAEDADRHVLLIVDSITTTGGMELTDNLLSTVYAWFFNMRSIAGDFAVLAIAHSVKSAKPDKLDPETDRAERLAGGFAWSTNVRSTIEVRRPMQQSYTKGRGGKIIADEWWETQGLPEEHTRAIVVQVAKENVGGLTDNKMWLSPRRVGAGAFRDITHLMSGKPRSYIKFLERGTNDNETSGEQTSGSPKVDRSKAKALVLAIAQHLVKEKIAITANAIQNKLGEEAWKRRDKAGVTKLKPAKGGFASNGTLGGREREGSPKWHLQQLVLAGLMTSMGTRFTFVPSATDDQDEDDVQ